MSKKFGDDYIVNKEECVGHVQKRLGTNLREYKRKGKGQKLSDGKGIGGAGRLTDKVIDKMQNYYGKAIRDNKGDLEGMKRSISAIFKHMIRDESLPLESQHSMCPQNKNTWCKFWKDKQCKTKEYDDKKRLPSVFQTELQSLFDRLSDNKLLERCLLGLIQNQNESINGMLWAQCPKNVFCGK